MGHPLDGAKLKVVRAQEHLDSIKREIRTYIDSNPCDISPDPRPNSSALARTISVNRQPPPLLSALVGDFLTNLRAALDYIAWEASGLPCIKPPRRDKDIPRIQFPISIEPFAVPPSKAAMGYVEKLKCLANRGVPTAIIDEIKAVQPYIAGNEPLWWLHQLVNIDKHRTLVLMGGRINDTKITYRYGSTVESIHFSDTQGKDTLTLTNANAEAITGANEKVEVDVQTTVHVAFEDISMPRESLDLTLEKILKSVANTIARFEKFFS